jgi:ribosomal-protein-serine acetyltransferase
MFCLTVDPELKLCLLEARHAEALFALVEANRAYLQVWLPWLDTNSSVADSGNFITRALEQFAGNNGFQGGIYFQGQLVGVIGYHQIDWTHRSVGVGYWLAETVQGQGIMTRACRYLVGYTFNELKLNRVEIRCATGNHKSRAIPERLGFKLEGTVRQAEWLYDHFVTHAVYGMVASEWPQQ